MKIGFSANQQSRQHLAAFTLAEVLVAVAVVAIGFVSLYAGIFFCFTITSFERENLRATQVMLERMEGIRLFNWDQLTDTTLNPTNFTERYYPVSGNVVSSGLIYTGTVVVAAVPWATSYSTNMKEITVTVRWASGRIPRSRSIKTYVAKDGIQKYIYYN